MESRLTLDSHPRKSILYNGHFFNIYGACKAIDVDTRHEVVIKTWKKVLIIGLSLFPKSQLHNISQVTNISLFPKSQLHNVFSPLKTWKTSANNRSFSISQEPTARIFSSSMLNQREKNLVRKGNSYKSYLPSTNISFLPPTLKLLKKSCNEPRPKVIDHFIYLFHRDGTCISWVI